MQLGQPVRVERLALFERQVAADKIVIENIVVDGRIEQMTVETRTSLADALRDELGVTSVRLGCEQGVCGSCSVVVDGVAQRSCLTLAVQADGTQVETLAGLAEGIEDLRSAFSRHFAVQCGFCASGVLVTAAVWLTTASAVDEDAVRSMLSGNVCRCSGYEGMVRAVLEVAADRGLTGSG